MRLTDQRRLIAQVLSEAQDHPDVFELHRRVVTQCPHVALASLVGLPVDGKTAALLCGRTYSSVLLLQNLARWSAAPPQLIAHLLRQEAVRRQPVLRAQLQRHPNAPAEARRGS